jgi:hypothetical protein
VNKEFQHCLESQLIEATFQKMLPIEVVSSVNWIQKQVTQVANAPSETKSMLESRNAEAQQNLRGRM